MRSENPMTTIPVSGVLSRIKFARIRWRTNRCFLVTIC
jgi:hypothetical protein